MYLQACVPFNRFIGTLISGMCNVPRRSHVRVCQATCQYPCRPPPRIAGVCARMAGPRGGDRLARPPRRARLLVPASPTRSQSADPSDISSDAYDRWWDWDACDAAATTDAPRGRLGGVRRGAAPLQPHTHTHTHMRTEREDTPPSWQQGQQGVRARVCVSLSV